MTIEKVSLLPKIENAVKLTGSVANTNNEIAIFFDFIDDESKTGSAQITDNFVESNYYIQDHIAIQPKIYRLKGYVGEVMYTAPTAYVQNWIYSNLSLNAKNAYQKVTSLCNTGSTLSPVVSSYTSAAINLTKQLNENIARYRQMINNLTPNSLTGKRQNTCSSILFYLMDNRTPMSISGLEFERLDGKIYDSEYYIQSVQSHQGNSRFVSDFEVVLKEVRKAETTYTSIKETSKTNANATQMTKVAQSGKASKKLISTTADAPKGSYLWVQYQNSKGIYSSPTA